MYDPSVYIVIINFLVGVNLILASGRVAEFAGMPFSRHPQQAARVSRVAYVSVLTLGSIISLLMTAIYILFHLLRLGI